MAIRHFCDFCGQEEAPGNDGIQRYVIMCLGPGEKSNRMIQTALDDVCHNCAKTLHLSVEVPDDY